MIEYNAAINGIGVRARYTRRAVDGIFIPLLEELTALRERKGGRVLAMLAAPPGAGKSTLASFLEALSRERPGLCALQAVGMDGFHRPQSWLQTHFTMRDGERIPVARIKGAPASFDLPRLAERVGRVAAGEKCGWPAYDRALHDPVEDALTVDGEIVLLEGNYLLLDEDGWRGLSRFADYTIFVRADGQLLRGRLIERKVRGGMDRETAAAFVDYSDMPNVRLCLDRALPADAALRLDSDGDYHSMSRA